MRLNIYLLLLILLLGILAAAVGGGLLVLLSYAAGWLVARILPLSPYEATFLSLIAIIALAFLVARFLGSLLAPPLPLSNLDDDLEADEFDDEDFEEDEDLFDETEQPFKGRPARAKTGQRLDFRGVKPDDRCPCGSGRKYKNCHGRRLRQFPRS